MHSDLAGDAFAHLLWQNWHHAEGRLPLPLGETEMTAALALRRPGRAEWVRTGVMGLALLVVAALLGVRAGQPPLPRKADF